MLLSAQSSPVSVLVERVTHVAQKKVPSVRSAVTTSSVSALLANNAIPALRVQFERIRFAELKLSPRLCRDLVNPDANEAEDGSVTFGNLLSLCLARTTNDASRCSAIPDRQHALKQACLEGLEAGA